MKPDPDEIVVMFGTNLKAARQEMGLTQAQLAAGAGLVQQYVSLIESGRQNVTLTTAKALAQVVHRDVTNLLTPARSRSATQKSRSLKG